MDPIRYTQPIVGYAVFLWSLIAMFVLPCLAVWLGKKKFSFITQDFWKTFKTALLLAVPFSVYLNVLALVVSVLLAFLGVPIFVANVGMDFSAWFRLTFFSVFFVWCVFWFLVSIPLVLAIFKKIPRRSKQARFVTVVCFTTFVVFFLGVIGINRLRDYYKYCPEQFICKRAMPRTYQRVPDSIYFQQDSVVPVQPAAVDTKTRITSLANGAVLVPANGYVEIAGTAEPGKYMLFAVGIKNPEQWRYGKEEATFTTGEPIQVASDGKFSVLLKESIFPKGEVSVAAFTLVDSDVPWASVYNAAIVKVTHK